jgi:hypothetical protein
MLVGGRDRKEVGRDGWRREEVGSERGEKRKRKG